MCVKLVIYKNSLLHVPVRMYQLRGIWFYVKMVHEYQNFSSVYSNNKLCVWLV
jgi:hypothetical protein